MDESYRSKMIEDLNELIKIPDVDTYIFLTIEQAKIKFAQEIGNYRQIKNTFHHSKVNKTPKRGNMMLIEGKNPDAQSHSYYFELKRSINKDGKLKYQWNITTIKPKPKPEAGKIIPKEFINMIELHEVDPDKIETYKRFKSRSLKKSFDIRFTRYSETHIMGSIRENPEDILKNGDKNGYDNARQVFKLKLSRKNIKEDYMELFRYMEEYPEIKEDIFNRFNMVQKPYVDNDSKQAKPSPGD
jgi:hypothetical protein